LCLPVLLCNMPCEYSSSNVRSEQKPRSLEQACGTAKIAHDYRGRDTLVLDMTNVTPLFDYFVVTTGTSRRQIRAISEEVDRVMKEHGSQKIGIEGYDIGSWVLQDYGDIVVHVFTPETRALYDLEHLWADASHVDWQVDPDCRK